MDPLFENCCEVNETMIVGFHKAQYNKSRMLYLTAVVVAAIVLIRTFIGVMAAHSIMPFGMITMVVNVFVICFLCCSTSMVIKKTVGYFRNFTGSETAEMTYQFGDTIRVVCNDKTMELPYRKITMVDIYADHMVLGIQKNMMLFVAVDGFTKGTFAEFKQFLRTKRPDLKIPE